MTGRARQRQLGAGVCLLVTDPAAALTLARVAESAGADVVGVADSPGAYPGTYPITQLILGGTSRIRVGPMVANPVTCHPAEHGANLAALSALYPDRVLAAFGSGDSATGALGLAPASPRALAACVTEVADRTDAAVPLWVAVSGPRAAGSVPPAATAILLGGGLDASWLRRLIELAENSAGHRLQRWILLVGCLVADESKVPAARSAVAASVLAISRHGLTRDPAAAGVPDELLPGLRAMHSGYDVRAHGQHSGRNAGILDGRAAESAYLYSRFAAVGTAAGLAPRLCQVAAHAGLDGVIFTATVPDAAAHIRAIGHDLRPLLRVPPPGPLVQRQPGSEQDAAEPPS